MNINIKQIGTFLGSLIACLTAIWFFAEPFLEDYIYQQTEKYIQSDSFKLFVDETIKKYEKESEERNTNKVSLRSLLSTKMGIDEDEVHIELGRLYTKEKDYKEDVSKQFKSIKKEIHYYHNSTILDAN